MKSLKIVFASLFLAVGAIAVSSFTVKEYNSSAFATKCYEYVAASGKFTLNNPFDANFVVLSEFRNTSNWIERIGTPSSTVCPDGVKICRLCFDDSQLTGGITFTDVLEDLHAYLVNLGQDPPHNTPIVISVNGVNFTVTIYEKA